MKHMTPAYSKKDRRKLTAALVTIGAAGAFLCVYYGVGLARAPDGTARIYLAVGLGAGLLVAGGFAVLLTQLYWAQQHTLQELNAAAFTDPVTGGPNSTQFEREAARRVRQQPPDTYALVSLDVVGFKAINEAFGSQEGDRLLRYGYDTFSACLEPDEYLARTTADHFKLLLRNEPPRQLYARLEEMANKVNRFNWDPGCKDSYWLQIRGGVCVVRDPGQSITILRDQANLARKKVQLSAGNQLFACEFYAPKDQHTMLLDRDIFNQLDAALEAGRIRMYLQPKVDLATGETLGAEALTRWLDEDGAVLYTPAQFIPVLERHGTVVKLDGYLFEQACRRLRRWLDEGRRPVPISVNFSRAHLRQPDVLGGYQRVQQQYGIPPELLEIELTETMIGEDIAYFTHLVQAIHAKGFRCALDDFGSGYSSMTMLKDVPVDTVKLDRSFFLMDQEDAVLCRRAWDIIESVIALAKKLGIATVAEGIEDQAQVQRLRACGCDSVQGYVFSKPVPPEEFEQNYL